MKIKKIGEKMERTLFVFPFCNFQLVINQNISVKSKLLTQCEEFLIIITLTS